MESIIKSLVHLLKGKKAREKNKSGNRKKKRKEKEHPI